jgi:hypothetical protein
MLALGINPEVTDKYIAELGEITYAKTKTARRKKVRAYQKR